MSPDHAATPSGTAPLASVRSGAFVAILVLVSLPFWLVAAVSDAELFPGLPLSALMAWCPLAVATWLSAREGGRPAVAALLARAVDWRRIPRVGWYLPLVGLVPAVMVASYAIARATGAELPQPEFPPGMVLAMSLAFWASAAGEELGWSGYLTEPWADRWGRWPAALALGVVWALWHLVPYAQAGRPADWIWWQCLNSVALRIELVWFYYRLGRSVWATIVLHAMINLGAFLFPRFGSHYDPQITAMVNWGVISVVAAAEGLRSAGGRGAG